MRIHKDSSNKDYEEKARIEQENKSNKIKRDEVFFMRERLINEPDF